MAIKGLLAARTKLMGNADFNNFFLNRYGKNVKHVVGYKRSSNADNYPFISYVPLVSSDPKSLGGMGDERVSFVIGVNEPGETDDVYDWIVQLDEAERLLKACLDAGELGPGAMYKGQARTVYDLNPRHPFYEIEISVLVAAR